MGRQKLTERNAITTATEQSLIHVVNSGSSYKITKANFQKALTSGFVGSLAIADTPTADGVYIAEESGTYTNAGSLVVSLTNKVAYIVVGATQTTFELIEITLTIDSTYANVKEYGAVGDGVTDDTTAIQNAIDNADNKPVLIPYSNYLISASLDIPSNCEIISHGTILRDTGVATFDMLVGDSVDNVIIRGGKIDGVALTSNADGTRFCGIRFWDSVGGAPCTNILVQNVEVTNTTHGEAQAEGNRGAITMEDTVNGVVDGCIAYNNRGSSVLMHGSDSKDCKVINCYLYDNNNVGSAITGNAHTGLIVDNNHCYNTKYTSISVNGKNAIISNNIVYNAPDGYAGITIGHNTAVSNASGTICSNNIIRDCGATTSFIAGIVVMNSDNVLISGNTIKDNANHGIRFLNDVVDATGNCKIVGNIIESNIGYGILMEWGENHVIDNNTIINNANTGVFIDGAKDYTLDNLYIKNNLFKDNGNSTGRGGVVNTNPTSTSLLIKIYNNIFEGTGTLQYNGIWVIGANVTAYVKGNDFDSSYTEAQAYRITTSGTIEYKQTKSEKLILVTSLLNGWTAASSLGYWKDNNGVVHLQGAANSGTLNVAAFNLPVGYRPAVSQDFATTANNVYALAKVSSTGDVILYTSNTNHTVNNISFLADNSADAS